ncbi:MAG: hypothetical protein N4A57_16565 [Anaeromicrobium sp.]|jgi:hypothetical protein|uniref:hypothetical protein n=1 Tax=Anaeromicrobium sp. TaxID=1929132 RepID=UPI0025D0D42B|nr:hypothetical protein [Anaeromicrobium sp.]MCT4595861.1 hypothetical protein [Anaeromicrobium sp.]
MELIIILGLIIINIPAYKYLYNKFFFSIEDFLECIRYCFIPNWISFIGGEYWDDIASQMRFGMFIFCCVAIVGLQYLGIKIIWNIIM